MRKAESDWNVWGLSKWNTQIDLAFIIIIVLLQAVALGPYYF